MARPTELGFWSKTPWQSHEGPLCIWGKDEIPSRTSIAPWPPIRALNFWLQGLPPSGLSPVCEETHSPMCVQLGTGNIWLWSGKQGRPRVIPNPHDQKKNLSARPRYPSCLRLTCSLGPFPKVSAASSTPGRSSWPLPAYQASEQNVFILFPSQLSKKQHEAPDCPLTCPIWMPAHKLCDLHSIGEACPHPAIQQGAVETIGH